MARALGKLPRQRDPSAPTLGAVMGIAPLPAPPPAADWSTAVSSWPMLGNDDYGDCAWAAMLHAVQLWTACVGAPITPDATCALDDYAEATGFCAGPPAANDNGTVLIDAVKRWMTEGIAIAVNGALDRLDGFAVVEAGDVESIKRSIADFGCCYLGVELPSSAEAETDEGRPWAITTDAPGCWGGHCVLAVAYDAEGMTVVTWGALQRLTWAWWAKYGSEAYALLRREWLTVKGTSPGGLTMAEMDERILLMRGTLGLGAA